MFTINVGVNIFELSNVAITGANNNYGAVLYNTAAGSTATLSNVTLTANVTESGWSSTSVLYNSNADLIIKDSTIANHTVRGLIYTSGGNLTIINTAFENNNASMDSSAIMGAIYSTGAVNVIVDNSSFINTASRQGAIYVTGSDSNLTVIDSSFVNSSAEVGSGAALHAEANLIVDASTFINNSADKDGGAIYAYKGGSITHSYFEGGKSNLNEYGGYGGDEIAVYGDLTLNYNAFVHPATRAVPNLVKAGSSVEVDAKYNWWGTNEDPNALVSGFTVDNWVLMTVSPAVIDGMEVDDVQAITAEFTSYTDGTNVADLADKIPEVTVSASKNIGTLDQEKVVTVDNEAVFTYTATAVGDEVLTISSSNAAIPISFTVSESYTGPIYVSKDGSDENVGSEDAPVATIAKAVELANAGSGQVIITEGTYYESNITLDAEKSIAITGEGNVVIDAGESTDSTFYMHGGEAAFTNIAFTGGKPNYDGAIRVNAARGGTNRNIIDINLTVDNCTFKDSKTTSRGGAIYAWYTKGNMVIKDSEFSGMNTSGWGGAVCVGYSAYEGCLNFEVVNSSFHDNAANNGGALYVYADKITIADSTFYNNNATYSPGAMYLYNATATIDNCTIYDNHGKNTAAAIEIEAVSNQPIATLTITNSVIENNTGTDALAPAINVDKATLVVSYSSLVNDLSLNTVTATGYDAVYGQGIAIANNNGWGTNDPTTAVNGTNITIDKWVIMNVEANATDVVAGDEVKLTVDFNHVNTTAGEIEELTGGVIPKESFTVEFIAENGTVAPETIEVPKGGSADAIFTASQPNAVIIATCDDATATIVFEGEIPEPYTGIVYVSKDGDDANNGSEDAPVSTIAKAIEIATAEAGSGQIVIKEGTYTGSDYLITKDLSITGEGDVVIDGEGQGRLFYMNYGAEVNKFAIANVVLTGAKHNYGAAVYSFAKETELDNVTITGNPGAGDLITVYADLTIKDSEIRGNNGGDVIQASGDATIILNNTLFAENEVTASSSDYGIVYISSGKTNLIVEGCDFVNNTARQGTIVGSYDANITVINSTFASNKNTISYGGAIRAQNKLIVTDSVFIGNEAFRDGGAIYVGFRGDATITKSLFLNNNAGTGYHGDAIYNGNKATANYNIFLGNGTKYVIFNDGEDNVVNAQYNWWGTNDDPKDLNGKGTYEDDYWEEVDCADVDSSNWIIMNVEADVEDVGVGTELPIAVDFKHYLDADGEVQELADSLGQELSVSFISETGVVDPVEAITIDQVATASYTVADGTNKITVKSDDASVDIEFESAAQYETTVTVVADNVWIGNPVDVSISVADAEGNPVEGTVTVKFGDMGGIIELDGGSATYTIPAEKLVPGENTVEASYNGLGQYLPSEGTGTFMVLDGVVTKDTFEYYFDVENNGVLYPYVPEGATLDFQGDFIGAYTTNINKPVNIVSTTGDAFIETNKTGSFNIVEGGSGTNVSGLKFLNTAFYITTAHNVVIDNINMVANMSGVGSGTGFLSIRSNSSYVTVKNSYFENGGTGSSCVVIGTSSYCTIDNNILNATKNSGNILY